MSAASFRSHLKAMLFFGVVAIVLFATTDSVGKSIRNAVRDSLKPGQLGLASAATACREQFDRLTKSDVATSEFERSITELNAWKLRYRRLQLTHLELRERMQRFEKHGAAIAPPNSSDRLLTIDLLDATILGDTASALWRSGKLLDIGSSRGVEESALVIQSDGLLIDQGRDAKITEDLPVYCGRCVVGKIEHAGRWSSSVQIITDKNFRELVALARPTGEGLVFTAQGQLEGTGQNDCRLTLISAGEPVSVGDGVYSIPARGLADYPMFYGTVTHAKLESGSMHWSIRVKPAVPISDVRSVQVLRATVNPIRMLGN